ncbi:MAG: lantibiotic dehydratase [Chitinophaga sp.]|uniref:lantibiotic dehydratase n=1 Tax=Chitinophaga sp. TaxID=1869181 RepID=UPI001B16D9D6|nr:lantibiotic dehydratase [Chitinophaga sp.]MBO9730658.1 lantibiotic dehydratase [Chitinophaga sp.]
MSVLTTCGFYLLRMPLLSCEDAIRLHRRSQNQEASFTAAIREIYASPLLQEAVFLASPALHTEMMKWLEQPDHTLKMPLALYRYLLRMTARCTPYGLFAGCVTGRVVPAPSRFSPAAANRHKVTRLDMEYLSDLVNELVQWPGFREQIPFYPNNSLYPHGQSARYFEYQLCDKKRRYYLSAFTQTDYTRAVLQTAASGATIAALIATLEQLDIPTTEARIFIESLITNHILVTGLTPAITRPHGLQELVRELSVIAPALDCLPALQRIGELLLWQTTGVAHYQEIRTLLTANFPEIPVKDPVQVDLFFEPAVADLSDKVTTLLSQQLERLAVLGNQRTPQDLETFKQQFIQQYDQREIPLMQALDSESGIGYGVISGDKSSYTPLIDDLVMPASQKDESFYWNAQTKFVQEQFLQARQQQRRVIDLTDKDLDTLRDAGTPVSLPPYMTLLGALIATDAAALDCGDFQLQLRSCNGPNALALMGRFAAGNDTLQTYLKAFADSEQALEKDRILAEIVHLPEGRIGNVLLRPRLYDYEIPFLGKSGVDEAFQIPVSDLYVSVRHNRVILRSARLNKEVLPRLTSAHNYHRGLAVYKFLGDLQQQQSFSLGWNWGHLSTQPFLPRVVYQQVILERARWYISQPVFQELLREYTPAEAIQQLKTRYHMPDLVMLTEGDNELLIQLNDVFAVMLLTDKLRKGSVLLYEQLFNEGSRLLANESGFFCNEVIIPFYNKTYHQPLLPLLAAETKPAVRRHFPPGSEWLYAKIYCGAKWTDKLLIKTLLPLVHQWQATQLTDYWFFIRYHDPEHHIRIRFHLPDYKKSSPVIIQQLQEALLSFLDDDIVQKIQFDTYTRELERYGAGTMVFSEQFFFHDSIAVSQLLLLIGAAETNERWLLALKGADDLLTEFGYTPRMKWELFRQLQRQFFEEHHGDDNLQFQLNNKYRAVARQIAHVLDDNGHDYTLPAGAAEILYARRMAMRELAAQIRTVEPLAATALMPHYLHMFLNRMFSASARLQELVIYHYGMKYYASKIARG